MQTVTIPANGMVALQAIVQEAASGASGVNVAGKLVPSEIKMELFQSKGAAGPATFETLVPSRLNSAIAIGAAGGNITYANSDSSLSLVFTDTTGIDGSGAADGILSGDELTTSASWTLSTSAQTLSISGTLPGNLQTAQFPDATLETGGSTLAFADTTTLAAPEGGAGVPLTLLIDPPLRAPAVARLVAIGAASGNSLTATAAGGDFPDVYAEHEITLPAGAGKVVVALANVRDDLIVEPSETFELELRASSGMIVPKAGAERKLIEITDDDSASFWVESSHAGRRLSHGESAVLTGRLNTIVQVGDGSAAGVAELTFADKRGDYRLAFFDADTDGYLRGDELASRPLSIPFRRTSNHYRVLLIRYKGVTLRNSGLARSAFRFARATADDARTPTRRDAVVVLAGEAPVPVFATAETIYKHEKDMRDVFERRIVADLPQATLINKAGGALHTELPVKLNLNLQQYSAGSARVTVVVTARYDADGEGGNAARVVHKTLKYGLNANTAMPMSVTFTHNDFSALGLRHDLLLGPPKIVTTSAAFSAATLALRHTNEFGDPLVLAQLPGVNLFSDVTVPGPDIVFAGEEASRSNIHVYLVDADGRQITQLEAGKRTDAFVKAEIRFRTFAPCKGANCVPTVREWRSGAAVAVSEPQWMDIALRAPLGWLKSPHADAADACTLSEDFYNPGDADLGDLGVSAGCVFGATGLTRGDLGYPDIPHLVIKRGESSAVSERAISITPVKPGRFTLVVNSVAPGIPGAFGAFSHIEAVHNVTAATGAKKWLVTLDETAVEVSEGDTGLSAALTLTDAETGVPAPLLRGGREEAVTVQYQIGAAANGASAADLSLSASTGNPRSACPRCEALFGAPLVSGSVNIAAGESSAQISLPGITDDNEAESDERFVLMLTALTDASGLPLRENNETIAALGLADATAEYTIAANDGGAPPKPSGVELLATPLLVLHEGLDASASDAQRSEITSSGVITITRPEGVRGRIRGVVRGANLSTDGAADYTLDDTFEIAPAQYSADVRVTALSDNLTEQHEEFNADIFITEPGSGVLPPAAAPKVVILDNDRPMKLALAETALSGEEGDFLEVKVQLRNGSEAAPPRAHPVSFTLTPTLVTAAFEDFMVSVREGGKQVFRAAKTAAELTATGVLDPDKSEAGVSFFINADGAAETAAETLTFTLSLAAFADEDDAMRNTHGGGIELGDALQTTVSIAASTAAAAAANVLVITPTTITRAYGDAAPGEYSYTIAPQAGSTFESGDTAATGFFTANPLSVTMPDTSLPGNEFINPSAAGGYPFKLADSPAYAGGIDAKYDFVLAADAGYTITPKEITFTGRAVDKPYDGNAFAPRPAFTGIFASVIGGTFERGVFAEGDIEAFYLSGMSGVTRTHDDVYVRGGVYAGGKNAGAGGSITGLMLGGAQSANYALSASSSAAGAITPRMVRISFEVLPLSPADARAKQYFPRIDREKIQVEGVLQEEAAGFRAGLRFITAYENAPESGAYQNVTMLVSGFGCPDDSGMPGRCGMTDSGNFTASNYVLDDGGRRGVITRVLASGLIAAAPGKPGGVLAQRRLDEASAAVSWFPPAAGAGGDIRTYYVRWRSAAVAADANAHPPVSAVAAGRWQNAAGDSELGEDVGAVTRHTIRGLLPGRGYEVQVRAENQFGVDGRGEYSDSAIAFGKPPPLALDALTPLHGSASMRVEFRAPAAAGGGEATPLARWRVRNSNDQWLPAGGVLSEGHDALPRGVSEAVIGADDPMTADVEYEVQLALRNSYGIGDWSASRFATLRASAAPTTSPGDMTGRVFANAYGGPNIEVTWLPPADGGAPIGTYEVR
ncbi:MAG: fibronectin type III domain-containing protein, partial [Gammaproteobacteria bacterium]